MLYSLSFFSLDSFKWIQRSKKWFTILFLFVIYLPWIVIIFLSFVKPGDKGEVSTNLWNFGKNWSFDNYFTFFSFGAKNDFFWGSLWNSFSIAISALCPSLWIALLTAFSLWKRGGRYKSIVFKLSNLSISSPELIQGLSFMLLFIAIFLPLGYNFGYPTIVLSHIAFLVPYGIILIYPRLEKLNKKLLFAGKDLNCGELETLFKIVLPQIKGTIAFCCLVLIILSMDDFIITNLVKGRVTTLTTQLYTMKKGVKAWSMCFGSISLLLAFTVFIGYSFFKKEGKRQWEVI
ncbi:spermidine/putrescine ABC transporter permease [Mycoplasma ovis str. Michigan]|uniref:Spermidine/putrescine ABC transporter permease n=1 Tax=Mycoplasma ovis str. Michigan TaxID=1415773 RepID=A0ABM5P0U5_9MOLU|nr:ABC transporter permease subunit [Mycoplasma ovis]AHC40040.1 spermidine/putrescine ABC transporter permease [Mycoplasma ovis str. Michigan]